MARRTLEHPPDDHVLRELGAEIDVGDDGLVRGSMVLGPTHRAASGEARLGVVATFVDMLGGVSSIRACTPDRVATADMSVHLVPAGRPDRVEADLHVRRRGRRTLVMEADLHDGRGTPIGLATLSFAILRQPPGAPVLDVGPAGRRPLIAPMVEPTRPFAESAGIRVEGPGEAAVDVAPRVRNSLGALNGGLLTTLIDEAVASAAGAALGVACETTELHVAFLELGRVGPVRARATVVGEPAPGAGRATVVVEVTDDGAGGEVLTRATGVAVPS